MSDDAQPTSRESLPPVRMALRVIGRHGHRGPHLARAVSEARAPKHLAASTRLAHPGTGHATPPPPAAPAPAPAPAPAADYPTPPWEGDAPAEQVAREPMPERPAVPGMSDFASEFLFGDQTRATSGLTSMAAAEKMPEPTKEEKLARRRARGALDVSRAAKILEGPAPGTTEDPEAIQLPGMEPPAAPAVPTGGPAKVSRTPSGEPAKAPSAPEPSAAAA